MEIVVPKQQSLNLLIRKIVLQGDFLVPIAQFSLQLASKNCFIIMLRSITATTRAVHTSKVYKTAFHNFYTLQEHKRKEHVAQRISEAQNADVT